jgi:hypothetical protein
MLHVTPNIPQPVEGSRILWAGVKAGRAFGVLIKL